MGLEGCVQRGDIPDHKGTRDLKDKRAHGDIPGHEGTWNLKDMHSGISQDVPDHKGTRDLKDMGTHEDILGCPKSDSRQGRES